MVVGQWLFIPLWILAPCAAFLLIACSYRILLALIAIGGIFIIGAGSLESISVSFAVIIMSSAAFWRLRNASVRIPSITCFPFQSKTILLFTVYCILTTAAFFFVWSARTTATSLGPWEELSPAFLVLFFLGATFLFSAVSQFNEWMIRLALIIHTLMATTLALIIYPLGYGFDPFLHHATQEHIVLTGSINPIPLIYSGHYAVMVFTSKITGFPVAFLDSMLVPLLAGIAVPLACYHALKEFLNGSSARRMRVLLLALAVPYPYIIITTPWSFALVLVALSLCLFLASCGRSSRQHLLDCWIFSSAAFFVHPLAGIPALFFAASATIFPVMRTWQLQLRVWLTGIWLLLGSVLLAGALAVYAIINNEFAIFFGLKVVDWIAPILPSSRFNILLDPTYLWSSIVFLSVGVLSIFGAFALYRHGGWRKDVAIVVSAAALATLGNAFIMRNFISFSSLISYERDDYSERLIHLALLFLFPLSAYGISLLVKQWSESAQRPLTSLFFTLLAGGIIAAGLYLSYPRNDAFASYHGTTVSASDIEAVRWIHNDSKGKDYAVLANQVSAAAAIREYGFYRYYPTQQGEQFYYSIPASSRLHNYFTKMASRPEARIIEDVRTVVPVSTVYFILHDYEPRFKIIANLASQFAAREQSFNDSAIRVFVYEK